MKTVRTILIDLLCIIAIPFYLLMLLVYLPYGGYIWLRGIIDTMKGNKPSLDTEFDTPYEDYHKILANRDEKGLASYVTNTTINNNISIDSSTHINNDSHSQTINNYFYGETTSKKEDQDKSSEPIEVPVTFTVPTQHDTNKLASSHHPQLENRGKPALLDEDTQKEKINR